MLVTQKSDVTLPVVPARFDDLRETCNLLLPVSAGLSVDAKAAPSSLPRVASSIPSSAIFSRKTTS